MTPNFLALLIAVASTEPRIPRDAAPCVERICIAPLEEASKEPQPHLLHTAILENSPEVIRFLLSQKICVDQIDSQGMTPLMIALINKNHFAVEALLKAGSDPKKDWKGMSPLNIAFQMNDAISADLLMTHRAMMEPGMLNKAIERGWIDLAKKMVDQGADTSVALATAIDCAELELLKHLIEVGSYDKEFLLQHAIEKGQSEIAQYLLTSPATKTNKQVPLLP